MLIGKKLLLKACIVGILEELVEKYFAKGCSAPFVAKDIAEWWDVLENVFPVVQARIGSGAEYSDESSLMHADGPRGAKQIAFHVDGRRLRRECSEDFAKRCFHMTLHFCCATGSIEVDGAHWVFAVECRKLGQEFVAKYVNDLIFALMKWVDALSLDTLWWECCEGRDETPIGFGGSTVGNEYHL